MRYIKSCKRSFRTVLVFLLTDLMTFASPSLSQTALARRSTCPCRRPCPQVRVATHCCQPVVVSPVSESCSAADVAGDTDSAIINTEPSSVNNSQENKIVEPKRESPNSPESSQLSKAIHESFREQDKVSGKDEQRSIVKEQESYPVAEQLPPMEVTAPESTGAAASPLPSQSDNASPLSSQTDGIGLDSSPTTMGAATESVPTSLFDEPQDIRPAEPITNADMLDTNNPPESTTARELGSTEPSADEGSEAKDSATTSPTTGRYGIKPDDHVLDSLFGPRDSSQSTPATPADSENNSDEPKTETNDLDDLFGQSEINSESDVAGGLRSLDNRRWSDVSGRYVCRARLMQISSSNVQLLRENGRMVTVAIGRLSDSDLRFVRNQLRTHRLAKLRQGGQLASQADSNGIR